MHRAVYPVQLNIQQLYYQEHQLLAICLSVVGMNAVLMRLHTKIYLVCQATSRIKPF